MSRLAFIDGVCFTPESAKVSVYDRGFLYGDSVFETLRTYAGEPFALSEHLERLAHSAELVAIHLPVGLDTLAAEVRAAVRAAGNPESYVRLSITRGSGPLGLSPSYAVAPLRVMLVEPLAPAAASLYQRGVRVATSPVARASDAAPSAKVGNYLASLLALRRAQESGAHEVLIVDAAGAILEGATSNVFFVRAGALVTPPVHAGILPGITRLLVLDCAEELGIPVVLEALRPDALAGVDEAFLTSSLREILPIVEVGEHRIGDGQPGGITRALHRAFRRRAGLGDAPMPWQ